MMHGFGMGFGWILWLAIIGLVIWFVVKYAQNNQPNSGSRQSETPEEILKRRLANGEISPSEFEEMKKKLME